jgi:twitching motility protein PilT
MLESGRGISDLIFSPGRPPQVEQHGELTAVVVPQLLALSPADTARVARDLINGNEHAMRTLSEQGACDLSYSLPDRARFRVNVFRQRGTYAIVMRVIASKIPSFEELGLPPVVRKLAEHERGLVLVTGPTGSGKSTTLAAMLDMINKERREHIITLEDPIEYLHRDNKSIVSQREIGVDTDSFAHALRSALRQDPDVILVGEMRDFETIETALIAAETGHLVFSTLHTLDATETINRIISVFPPHQQKQVRIQLASVLRAVVSQRLIPKADGKGRAPAVEVLISTAYIRDCIVDKDKTHLIPGAIAQGTSQYGMQTFDQSIFSLFERGLISIEEALRWVSNVDDFKLKVQGISTTAEMARDQMARAAADGVGAGRGPEITRFGG